MAKTTNHPPYEIDPWKADVTEPPSDTTFNPEIVEAIEKPKQESVPPQPTEGQQKIEESISRVDRFNNEINALREQQEQVLQEVQAGINETSDKIKQLNDLEERIKQQVDDYTEDTDRYLREAELLRGELEEAQGKMDKAVTDASSAIDAAESAQNALEAYKNGEKARLEEAINEAQIGVAKADDVNKQIADLKNSLSGEVDKQISTNNTIKEIQSNNEALGSRLDDVLKTSKQGVEDAAKAIEILENRVEIGTSLIPYHPGGDYPEWTTAGVEKVLDTLPNGEEGYVWKGYGPRKRQDVSKQIPVKVDPRLKYRVTFWVKSDYTGEEKQSFYFYTVRGMGSFAGVTKDVDYKGTPGSWWRQHLVAVTYIPEPNKWFFCEREFTLDPDADFITISNINWGYHGNGSVYIYDLRAEPIIPSQADVDRAQNKAIEAHDAALENQKSINKANEEFKSLQTDFNSSQIKLNKTYNAMWDAQSKRNLLQEGIDSAQTKAIKSLSKLDEGTSLISYYEPTDEEVQSGKARYDLPEWGEFNAEKRYESSDGYPGLPPGEKFAYGVSSDTGTKDRYLHYRPVIPETTYTLRFWAKGSGNLVIYMYGDGKRSYPITSVRQLKVNQDTLEEERDKDGKRIYEPNGNGNGTKSTGTQRLLSGFLFPEEWTYFSYEVTFLASTRNVRLAHFYWNWNIKSSNGQYISGMTFTPDIPSQAQIDKSQNEAIKANTLALENQKAINDKQKGIAAAHAKAIDSNRKAIRSLAKIDLGGSLLAYMPLTDEEIDKGVAREYLPAWAANATNVLNDSDTSIGYYFLGSKGGSAKGEEVYAKVSRGTQYLLDIEMSSSGYCLPSIVFKTSNSGIKNPIKRYYLTRKDDYGGLNTTTYTDDTDTISLVLIDDRTSILVEFKDDVEDICVERLEWMYANSITVKRFILAPYTPNQAAIDAQQNIVMNKLKKALETQEDMTKKQQEFSTKLYDMSAGVIHLLRDEVAASATHEIGFVMPSIDRLFKIYARSSFRGNLTILVNYNKSFGDGLKTYRIKDTNLVNMNNPSNISSSIIKESLFKDMPYSYRYRDIKVDVGDVESIVVLIDHINWRQV